METTPAFAGLTCTACDDRFDAAEAPGRCPSCGGVLDPTYDYDAVAVDPETLPGAPFADLWRYADLLPFPASAAGRLGAGGTPLVECPALADELGVGAVYVKDEGRNPTGSVADREQALAVTAAVQHGAADVALATTGNAGQSAAAYAARAGLDAHVFVPTRAPFVNKAMINVHGGDMSVVEGRFADARAAYEDAAETSWHSLQDFETPYRHEGPKTLLYEVVEQLDWSVPDHVVAPTGSGSGVVGVHKAATELRDLGLVDRVPSVYAAQAEGCAPVVEAFEAGRDRPQPWEVPDTICGDVEIPDPAGGHLALRALRESDGGAVATGDEDILDSVVTVAQHEGLEVGLAGAAAASGAWALANAGTFDDDDTVVLVNPAAGDKDADVARSHLMGKGI
ncbi:MAG: threonine synthase [Haloarculaceae archaeon]